MKKIIFLALVLSAVLMSCEDKNKYTLSGTLPTNEYDGEMVYLFSPENKDVNIDSAKVTDGKFKFEGIAGDTVQIRIIRFNSKMKPRTGTFFLEPGKIQMSIDTTINRAVVSGTRLNNAYGEYNNTMTSLFAEADKAESKWAEIEKKGEMTPEKYDEKEAEEKALMDKIEKTTADLVKNNVDNVLGTEVFYGNSYLLNTETLAELMPMLPEKVKSTDRYKKLETRVAAQQATGKGKSFTDIKGNELFSGREVALSDYAGKGKVVLVDFWASWCGPCRRSMPDLVKLYSEYKDRGFLIVGVSLDDSKEKWAEAVNADGITWPQFSNLKGWDEPGAKAYGVGSIPHTVLIDKNGVIVDKNLHGNALRKKIEGLLQ